MRALILRKLLHCFDHASYPAFSYAPANSYYLPEGRYYAAPAVYKSRRKKNRALPFLLSIGFLCFSVSALTQNSPLPVPANVTVLASLSAERSPRLNAAVNDFADTDLSGEEYASVYIPNVRAEKSVAAAVNRQERDDAVLRGGKGASVLAGLHNMRPRLVNDDVHYIALAQEAVNANFAAALKTGAVQGHVLRFQPPRIMEEDSRLAMGFIPAPVKKAPAVLPVPHMLAKLVNNDKPDILAYTEIPVNPERESPFDSILTDEKEDKNKGRFIPPIGRKDHSWAAMPLPAGVFSGKQQKCLAEAVYFEARGESLRGQAAIAQIVLNRVRNPAYPDTICNVVYQNTNLYNRCQFSFACDGKKHRVSEPVPWRTAQDVAKAVTAGQIWLEDIGSSTHYHAVYVRPHWAGLMDRMQKIGSHVFYRTKGGGWS